MGSPHSDDGGERPVRKQLSKASIEPTPQDSVKENTSGRKRSFEESRDTAEDYHEDGQVRKKRSRESTPEEPQQKQAGSKNESAGPQEVSTPVSSLSRTVFLDAEGQETVFDHTQKTPGLDQPNDLPECDEYHWTRALEEREKLIERRWQDVHHRDKVLQNHEKWYGECVDGFDASKSALKVRSRVMDKRERMATSREKMATQREKAVAIREMLVRIREEKVQKLEHELLEETVKFEPNPSPEPWETSDLESTSGIEGN
ncbi:uncharacterized protein N7498_002166 [Penicillium cinerascens]|uniref:Uncharacterized protein n=1 Tax=Penicillium cinerascens TaxID=70096 RepID=A0A9W9N9M6_9EURO|nr:uncharacterized protein N7498_002166 [Penicillium cinerascens]KAJ5215759.1 hypothetical protein N7498_002166 [Penicillium cinerascens]